MIDVNSTFHYILMCGGFLCVYIESGNESHLSITTVHSLQWPGLRPFWNWIGIMAISSSLCVPVSAEAIDLMDPFVREEGLISQTQLGKTLSEIQHGVTSWFTVWIIAETVMTHSRFNRWFYTSFASEVLHKWNRLKVMCWSHKHRKKTGIVHNY